METGPRFIVSSDRLETPGIEPTASGLRSDPGLYVSLLTHGEAVNLYLVIHTGQPLRRFAVFMTVCGYLR